MKSLDHVLRLSRVGRLGDALRALDEATLPMSERTEGEILRAVLLEQVGQSAHSLALATTLLKSKRLSPSHRSKCEGVLGRVLFAIGETEEGLAHLQRSALRRAVDHQ